MEYFKNHTPKKAKIALFVGIFSGFIVLAVAFSFLVKDDNATEVILWLGFSCALLPAFLLTDDKK